MAEHYFSTDALSVGYDGRALIRDICLTIDRGEIVTLIGPNGAGKSTILKSITRQLKLISGNVTIAGRALPEYSYRELSSRLAVVLTGRMQTELMTCRDIVATGRYPYTGRLGILSAEDEEKVTQAMEAVDALMIADRDFTAVSDGQRQRILLARAICQEPEIIVLDEPTSFLDVHHKLELLSILRRMAKEKGITVIMSLHEIDLAQKISDRIICVKGDTIHGYGTPEAIFGEASIRALYDIDRGFFDPLFGNIELPRPEGEADTLVLCGGGSGIPVFRMLQKRDRAFIAGILPENDMDYRLARLLAREVITTDAYLPITDAAFERAMACVERCATVIDAGVTAVGTNARMGELLARAETLGKRIQGDRL